MPPGPAFGWLCVLHSVTDIAVRAAQIRASQVLPPRPVVSPGFHVRKSKPEEHRMDVQLAGDLEATHDPHTSRTNDAFSTNPPVNVRLSRIDEQQVAPTLLPSQSEQQHASEQCSTAVEPPIPEDPKLAPSDILLLVETSLRNASSGETILDSAPMPSGTEDQSHEIESSAPLDYEVRFSLPFRFFVSFAYLDCAAIH
jgi:hypothetical protein